MEKFKKKNMQYKCKLEVLVRELKCKVESAATHLALAQGI